MLSKVTKIFKTYTNYLERLLGILDPNKKYVFKWLILFSIVISGIEIIGISAIMPFIAIATNYNIIETNQHYKLVYDFFNFSRPSYFVFALGFALFGFYVVRGLLNLLYAYLIRKFVEEQYLFFANNLFTTYMWMKYGEFTQKNSSNMTKNIMHEAAYAANFIFSFMTMLSEVFILVLIYGLLLSMNYQITIFITIIFLLSGIFLYYFSSKRIKRCGDQRAPVQEKYYEILNKNFGNYKAIKVASAQNESLSEFHGISLKFVDITVKGGLYQNIPRFFLEAIGFIIVIVVVLYLTYVQNGSDIAYAIPVLTVFVLGLYRMLPSVSRIIASFNTLLLESKAVQIIVQELGITKEILGNEKIDFSNSIFFENISFSYQSNKPVLSELNIHILKGSKIGIIGESGGGKSTLIALLMGLHKPNYGTIFIDKQPLTEDNLKSWRSKIGYIPQSIYLFDGTIAENIVFGRTYDENKIIDVLQKAHIYDFLLTKEGLDTFVGEGGILLSGGQKQRIAIARALYGDPEILILDEATSALDTETEARVMNEVYDVASNMTLILIAHRISTLEKCDKIYKIEDGKLIV